MSETPQNTYEQLNEYTPEIQPRVVQGVFDNPSARIENTPRGDFLSGEAMHAAEQAGNIAAVKDVTSRLKMLRSRKVSEPRKAA